MQDIFIYNYYYYYSSLTSHSGSFQLAIQRQEKYDGSNLEKYGFYVDKTIDYIPKRKVEQELLVYTDKKDKTNS